MRRKNEKKEIIIRKSGVNEKVGCRLNNYNFQFLSNFTFQILKIKLLRKFSQGLRFDDGLILGLSQFS